jgi:hypothetical protein
MTILNDYSPDEGWADSDCEFDPHRVFSNPPCMGSNDWPEPPCDEDEEVTDHEPSDEEMPKDVPDFELIRLSDVVTKPIAWLWPNRIAIGKLTILAGDPGLGKSTISLVIAATVSTGRDWPDSQTSPTGPGSVILLSAEDGLADTVKPRLEVLQADVSKIYALETVKGTDGCLGPFNLKTDVPRLEEAVRQAGDPRLVVIDPVSCYLGNTDENKNAAMRAVLTPLADMAERLGVAVLLISHMNKNVGGKSIYRLMGSLASVAAARTVWTLHRDPSDADRVLMLCSKTNIAKRLSGLALRIVDGNVEWESEPVDMSADDLLAIEAAPPPRGKEIDKAKAFIKDVLASGPEAANDVIERGKQEGLSERTLKRAKMDLGVQSVKSGEGKDQKWLWQLPASVPVASGEDRDHSVGTVGPLDPLPAPASDSLDSDDDAEAYFEWEMQQVYEERRAG